MNSEFKNDFIEIFYSQDKKMLIQRWSDKYPRIEEFTEAIDKTVELCRKFRAEFILSDITVQSVVCNDGTSYAASVLPVLHKYGLKKMAFILAEDIFLRTNVKSFFKDFEVTFIKYFDEENDAIAWFNEE